ncbi:hypothetical protein [Aeromicrobium sp. UC242_57]|uniref:hypothetical protein n=1 Tax=Aeromicrobium sp. UC242_57 TaxID=3374624 RepID=UPI0037879692
MAVGDSAELPFTIDVPQGMRNGSSFDAETEVTVSYGDQQRKLLGAGRGISAGRGRCRDRFGRSRRAYR